MWLGSELVLVHRDSYGDGGSGFGVVLNGAPVLGFQGTGTGNDWPLSLDIVDILKANCLACPCLCRPTGQGGVSEGRPRFPVKDAAGLWLQRVRKLVSVSPNATNTLWLVGTSAEGGAYRISTQRFHGRSTRNAFWSAEDCADWYTPSSCERRPR